MTQPVDEQIDRPLRMSVLGKMRGKAQVRHRSKQVFGPNAPEAVVYDRRAERTMRGVTPVSPASTNGA